ncbi:tectonic-like complex member MKS1 [Platichthys flesus]|uniref:tectonic-like complex member MKS1 n=1 Tax=Platichthys flesus TaxID=8260 RepID=UPI002DBABCEE|nr:tectonic-like complex member MKS1 [Platichthys flesus]
MADSWNTDTGEAVYRSWDAVKNLRVKVRIERVTSTAVLCQPLKQEVLSQQDRGSIELETLTLQCQTGDNEEELELGWQEKLYSEYEMELFKNKAACLTPLDRQYHREVKALRRAKGRQNHRLFTHTDHDRYTSCLPLHQMQNSSDILTTTKSGPTSLAERMATIKHRWQNRRTKDSGIPKSKIINWDPSEEFLKNSHVVSKAMQTMHIMGDLGPPGRLGHKENEYLLCTIKTDGSGTVVIKPDFNKGREPYRIVTEGEKREVWRLTVENVSTAMKPEEKEREQNTYKNLYVRHKDYLNSLVGQDFEMPPLGILRYFMNGEIVSAQGFEYDNLYINFFMELPNNWSSLPSQSLSRVTQTCQTKTQGKENLAFFSHPFSFEAFYLSEKESEKTVPQLPVLYFKVLSLDSWTCHRTEGCGYVLFPAIPGNHKVTCHTWRPLQTGKVSALRRFFIGGSPELEDQSSVRIPGTFKGERLSRIGFPTETTGSVTFNLNCIQQATSFVDAALLKESRQKGFGQLGEFCQQRAVSTILEAFHRARRKMQAARESFHKGLNSTTCKI